MDAPTNSPDIPQRDAAEHNTPRRENPKFKFWNRMNSKVSAEAGSRENKELASPYDPKAESDTIGGKAFHAPRKVDPGPESVLDDITKMAPEQSTGEVMADQATPAYNTRFLPEDMDTYCLENYDKNVMIIFNHVNVIGYKKRTGSIHDVRRLKETFVKYNFPPEHIIVHNDLNYNDLMATLNEFSESDFTDFGCVVVAVLTHGEENGYLMSKDRSYHESELVCPFFDKSNETLDSKPKVFIVQACRGARASKARFVGKPTEDLPSKATQVQRTYSLPEESDVLLLHSTFAGDISHCETANGSWFINSLCDHIVELADTEELERIMKKVKKDVAINKKREVKNQATGKTEVHKQMPVVTSSLTRDLYLRKSSHMR